MEKGSVQLEVINKVGIVRFYHPSSNAMPGYLLAALNDTLQKAGKDDNIKVLVLESEGRTFCAGASFDELMALKNHEQAVRFFMGFAEVINTMRQIPKFIIAKVQGKAVGGGVGLIAAADYAMATDKAAIKLSELSIGIGPYVIAPAVKRKIGISAFAELSINATTWHNAYWAKKKGLFANVYDHLNTLNEEVEILAQKLSGYDVNATRLLKQEIWEGTENWLEIMSQKAKISAQLVLQDFTKQALEKFKKK